MAYSLYDEKGYVGPVASIEGYNDMAESAQWGSYPELQKLFREGLSRNPAKLLEDVQRLLQRVTAMDPAVRHSFENLIQMLKGAKNREVLIVSE